MALFGKKRKKSDRELLIGITRSQTALLKRLETLEKKVEKLDGKQTEGFGDVIRGIFILYGKAVLTRLNFMELSEGKPISASQNELHEIDNSMRENPDPKYLVLPLQREATTTAEQEYKKKRQSKLN